MPRVGKSYIGCVPLKIVKDIQKSQSRSWELSGFFLSRFQFRNIWSRKQVSVLVSEKRFCSRKNLVSEKIPNKILVPSHSWHRRPSTYFRVQSIGLLSEWEYVLLRDVPFFRQEYQWSVYGSGKTHQSAGWWEVGAVSKVRVSGLGGYLLPVPPKSTLSKFIAFTWAPCCFTKSSLSLFEIRDRCYLNSILGWKFSVKVSTYHRIEGQRSSSLFFTLTHLLSKPTIFEKGAFPLYFAGQRWGDCTEWKNVRLSIGFEVSPS